MQRGLSHTSSLGVWCLEGASRKHKAMTRRTVLHGLYGFVRIILTRACLSTGQIRHVPNDTKDTKNSSIESQCSLPDLSLPTEAPSLSKKRQ